MKKPSLKQIGIAVLVLTIGGSVLWVAAANRSRTATPTTVNQKAALTVTTTAPRALDWPVAFSANGSIAAWQEAIVGSELGGLALTEVLANVGDVVKQGQVLARFASDVVAAEVAQQEAAVEESSAALSEAQANVERVRALANSGALSEQQISQILTAERSTQARLMSAQARLRSGQIRLRQTQLIAPDDGVISSRTATVGAVSPQGQELFKLIRKQRLEWRAEITSNDLPRIKPGQVVKLVAGNGARLEGKVRMIAPTVDPATRNGMVYVDLPVAGDAHAGMFASGEFELGRLGALTLPQSAVVMREGFNYVYQVTSDDKVVQTKVTLGRRVADRIEVVNGVTAGTTVVAKGAAFLADGDRVKVVPAVETLTSVPVVRTTPVVSPLTSK